MSKEPITPDEVAKFEADKKAMLANTHKRMVVPQVDEHGELVKIDSVVEKNSATVASNETIIKFRNRPMIKVYEPYPHYIPLTGERFKSVAYPLLGGVSRSRISDVYDYLANTVEDLTANENLILFGLQSTVGDDGEEINPNHPDSVVTVWDCNDFSTNPLSTISADKCIWRCPYAKIPRMKIGGGESGPIEFIMQLAGGDKDLYDDIMQSLAPIVMTKKPDGVVWWVGDGANGKSTLMDAIYKCFPGQLSSLTVKNLTDGRDTPSLNGHLANIVKESSEGRIEDTEIYKSIGTHEDFSVHKFHSQESITIKGNMHHIFSGNSIPSFNDKGHSALRRTFVIPFTQRFESDPTFEERTFTPEFFGRLVAEMCNYAQQIKRQGYRYKWSAKTLAAKAGYDSEANSAAEYAAELVREGVVGFESFLPVQNDYQSFCAEHGYNELGRKNLRLAVQGVGFEQVSVRTDGGPRKSYRLPGFKEAELIKLSNMRPGLYTVQGFQPETPHVVPNFPEPAEKKPSIIGDKW